MRQLDRGELEKLVARVARDFDEVELRHEDTRPREVRYRDDDDDDYRRDPRRKRRWYESLGNIFD